MIRISVFAALALSVASVSGAAPGKASVKALLGEVRTVQDVAGYNSWQMIQALGGRLVCAYSRGSAHTIGEGKRDVFARFSDDGGRTWSDETTVADSRQYGEVTIGKGLDLDGAMLLWVRCWGGKKNRHDLYRSKDGVKFEKISSPELSPLPMQITDVFEVPGTGLMSLWFAGNYRDDAKNAWGTLVSADNGRTWIQHTVEKGIAKSEWPTEPSAVHLGGGRILCIARSEGGAKYQFQLVSLDGGRTWKKTKTNISDVLESTPNLVLDRKSGTLANYYYQRGAKKLKRRVTKADWIFDRPLEWPEPEVIAEGFEKIAYDAGNVSVTVIGRMHYPAFYTGSQSDTSVFVVELPAPAAGSGKSAAGNPDADKVAWMLQTNLLERSCSTGSNLPKVLVLGDSISMGYQPILKRQLAGIADVRRPQCNCGATQFYLRERGGMKSWTGTNRWDVITVNCGIWDICYMKGDACGYDHYWGPGKNKELARLSPIPRGTAIRDLGYRVRTPILEYMANLRKILTYLKSTGATVIFPLTTPAIGYQVDDRCGLFRVYNEVAQAVCDEMGVKTVDFYAIAERNYEKIIDGAHFSDEGSGILASALSKEIVAALRARGIAAGSHVESPRILAHRGSRGEYQDNAAGGFAKCLKAGVTGFEVDIRLSKDGHLVVMHDADVSRTTGGKGKVEDMTLAEIRKCRLVNCSEPVPVVAEVLAKLNGRDDVFIELEMKASAAVKNGRLDEYCRKLNELAKRVMKPGTYAFTSFDEDYLKAMKRIDPAAPTGLIRGKPISEDFINRALELGCRQIAPVLNGSTRELVARARAKGLRVTLWMVQNLEDYMKAKALGADATTSDYPILLRQRVRGEKKKLVAIDLDATLCQHRSPVPPENLAVLKKLMERYRCVMVGAGNAPRIYRQMGGVPIEIVGNYGMQEADARSGEFRIVRAVTNEVDKAFFLEKTGYLRKKYGYTRYAGDPVEFHASGMVTFGLLGTAALREDKVKFDPDRAKRRAMYREVCEIFKDYSVYIGGSTSFDFAGKSYNKYDATLDWARRRGYTLDDIVFIGDDFADGGGDSHVRTRDKPKLGGYPRMDYIVINDYRRFPQAVGVLLK